MGTYGPCGTLIIPSPVYPKCTHFENFSGIFGIVGQILRFYGPIRAHMGPYGPTWACPGGRWAVGRAVGRAGGRSGGRAGGPIYLPLSD